MHWKIRRDPYLSRVWEKRGEEAVWASGFFFDEDTMDAPLDDYEWLCTPRPKKGITNDRPVVLLSTGGFCPLHDGHLAMMESARVAAEAAGFEVIGGYLSPGHEAYLQMKCGSAAIPPQERLLQCGAAVAQSDWLSVDPWEAMHRRVAVNYTDVAARLRGYLRAHVDPRIEVLYVCGGDNARFSMAFTELGGCIVVERPGTDDEVRRWKDSLGSHPRILWTEGQRNALASRELRPPVWSQARPRRLVVRLEDERAVRMLGGINFGEFQDGLLKLLSQYAAVRPVPLVEPGEREGVISLDPMLPAAHNLAISRLFAPGGYESRGHLARPGAAALETQAAAIPAGDYILRDDDCMTGSTLAAAMALFPPDVRIASTQLAIEPAEDEDVLDSRDFLLGSDDGGLVLELPQGGIGRAPYLLPYVDPAARASAPASHVLSREVWELNARVFAGTSLRVRDLPAACRATFATDPDRPLAELCTWHAERLRKLEPVCGRTV